MVDGKYWLPRGDGNDKLRGHKGNDVLIGGRGEDDLDGDQDEDILIGGFTLFDDDVDALDSIFAEWVSGAAFADRILNLTSQLLESGNRQIFDGDAGDDLQGGTGRDWYIAVTNKDFTDDKLKGFREDEDESFDLDDTAPFCGNKYFFAVTLSIDARCTLAHDSGERGQSSDVQLNAGEVQ